VRRSLVGGGSLLDENECVEFGIARSMRRTEAPLSARRSPAKGPEGCVSEAWWEVRGTNLEQGRRILRRGFLLMEAGLSL
jgi:hypothetical protein